MRGNRGRMVLGVVAVVAALAVGTPSPPRAVAREGKPVAASATTDPIDALRERELVVSPPLADTWVVDISGEPQSRVFLAQILQGFANRSKAQLYLVWDTASGQWIQRYEDQGLVHVVGHIGLDAALDEFAPAASGYVLGDGSEPWTLNVATTLASLQGALVATPDTVAALEARGLHQLDDLRGRWPDAVAAYTDLVDDHLSELPYQGFAVLDPTANRAYDLAYQQGMAVLYTRPKHDDYAAIEALYSRFPSERPVYGYVSGDGDEEITAIVDLSSQGKVLIPSDTTDNLSFHQAVGRDRARTQPPPPPTDVAPCSPDQVNVVLSITDGDNLVAGTRTLQSTSSWLSPRRGELPMGWSLSPSFSVLAPAIWDYYAAGVTPADELVPMIGYGYASALLLPEPGDFFRTTFGVTAELGASSFWSLGAFIDRSPDLLAALDAAAGDGPPHAILEGYGDDPGVTPDFRTPAGRPGFGSLAGYAYNPDDLKAIIESLLAEPAGQRPLVAFLSATLWSNPYAELADTLLPLQDQGVRFLTPAEAGRCVPAPPSTTTTTTPDTTTTPGTTATSATVTSAAATPVSGVARFAG